jgi:hypothetical protein
MVSSSILEAMAREILDGFGDAKAGEWIEDRARAFHIRRRLTAKEQELVGEAVDCRTTAEGLARFKKIANALPAEALALAEYEIPAR